MSSNNTQQHHATSKATSGYSFHFYVDQRNTKLQDGDRVTGQLCSYNGRHTTFAGKGIVTYVEHLGQHLQRVYVLLDQIKQPYLQTPLR
jgi:hypothetical protein